ncbi:molybdopterin-dependent oxidoreductase [Geomonas subterranea]|uniref:Molybdopterin-dependent oxidoreductase n=1 Tax=Geomonas subterranea TaxID=2847989 RepID=A0ABX8LIY1_9BACT|nr:molybdopterin-dependent oxidoreductase [Geomonas subterranea]QXE91429.1 molybdopterin-dependent oxidoreductase [Geomonas subterranea]QXM10483.1 molybdopterin-dependent oxidoreductase [Geomonas subterranea]
MAEDIKKTDGLSRRDFLKNTAVLSCGALVASQLDFARGIIARVEAGELTPAEAYELMKAENTLYTVCLNCNTGCGIKVKILDGVAVKIDGNPYNPFTLHPHFPMNAELGKMAKVDGAICPKGQSGHQGAYDPYRVRKVLKRAGKRGEGKWVSVPFNQAVDEIVNGGVLFGNVPGEENRRVTGLKELYALKDAKVAEEMAADVAALRKKKLTVAEFKTKHAANLDKLIDPDHPDFGPKNNQFVYFWGRKKGGRSDFAKRFTDQFGTVNTHGHTTVCQGSLYFACKAMSEQYNGSDFKDGQKFYWQTDLENAEYVLFVGSNLFDGNYGPPNRSPRLMSRLVEGKTKITVLDPRFTKLAGKANRWVPVLPGTDAAFAMGMTRWILENKRFDAKYLSNCNKAAAAADKESTWSNGAWLVKLDKDGKPSTFLRASEIGLKAKEVRKDSEGKDIDFDYLVTMKNGKPVAFDPNDDKEAAEGELFVTAEIPSEKGPVKVKSGLQVMLEAAQEKTIAEYATICGIDAGVIEETAREFTSYGKKASVDMHRGPAQHTNGFYNISSLMNLNLLVGNFDWRGGMIVASTYNADGTKSEKQPFNFKKITPKAKKTFGLSVIRHDAKYEESTLFSGKESYPAKRNWWPLSSDVYEEILPSIADAYPYSIKVLFSYMGAPTYSLPAGHTMIEALVNLERIPLYFASDIIVGTTTMYADYIFPDLHYLERWEMQGSHPNMPVKVQPVRNPVIPPPNEVVKVFGEEQPISYETLWMALAEKLGIAGFGPDGFGKGMPLTRPDDFYVRMVANVALDGKEPVADASAQEIDTFLKGRRHLPKDVFDAERWKRIAGPDWPKVVTVLNRGGRFDTQEASYKGDHVANKYGKQINLYQEKTYKCKDAFTGKHYYGMARYVPVADTLDRQPVEQSKGYDLHLITQRDIKMTKSRTISNQYLTEMMPENEIIVNTVDAKRLGLKTGEKVKVVSATNPEGVWDLKNGAKKPMVGKVKVTETIRPGIITFTLGHGVWATGGDDMFIDGKLVKGDPRRRTGVHANAAMWTDPHLKNTCMIDKVGGSVSFYDTKVRLVKI